MFIISLSDLINCLLWVRW